MYIPFESGKYEIKGMLGRGGEGDVYLLWDNEQCRLVAAKVSADIRRLSEQARQMERFRGSICPTVFSLEKGEDIAVLYMEYIEGVTLEEYRIRRGPLSEREGARVLIKVIDALMYVHQMGMTYLDIKPANIILRPDGRVCLLDFGAVRKSQETATCVGGTYGYAAPEQFWTGAKTDERSDVYACGKLLIYLLTQTNPSYPPYGDCYFAENLSMQIRTIIDTCISCDVRYRYRNLLALKEKLYESLERKKKWFLRRKNTNCIICENSIWKSDYFRE